GFNTMTESLRAAENWKKQIIADSAHELRTPVALIQGHLEMMLEGVYEINREGIQTLYDETLLLSSLISELQKLSSEEASRSILTKEPFRVEDFFESVKSAFKAKFEEAGISFKTSIDPEVSLLNADWQRLHQVFLNLIANSIRYTPSGGTIRISAEKDVSLKSIKFAVEDSGCGVPREERSKIFNRFYRVDKHRNRDNGGSGLGLSISREIINNHAGTIEAVDPLFGSGTRIQIVLPLYPS
ncbi:MAG: ATP-binding protein, partial [Spirochaetales bacterium]|nr:ATP-binding protein [Spirochaetales bacterium]